MQSDQLKLFGIRECLDPALDPTPKAAALITHRTRRGTLPCGAPLPLLRVVHCDLSGRGLLLGPLRVFLKSGFRPIAVLFVASEVLVQSDSDRILLVRSAPTARSWRRDRATRRRGCGRWATRRTNSPWGCFVCAAIVVTLPKTPKVHSTS